MKRIVSTRQNQEGLRFGSRRRKKSSWGGDSEWVRPQGPAQGDKPGAWACLGYHQHLACSGDSKQTFILLQFVQWLLSGCKAVCPAMPQRQEGASPSWGFCGFWGGPRIPSKVGLSGLTCHPGMWQRHPTSLWPFPTVSMALGIQTWEHLLWGHAGTVTPTTLLPNSYFSQSWQD